MIMLVVKGEMKVFFFFIFFLKKKKITKKKNFLFDWYTTTTNWYDTVYMLRGLKPWPTTIELITEWVAHLVGVQQNKDKYNLIR